MRNDINGMSDVLETVSVLRTAKNLFFFLSILSLLVLGTIFVFSRIGMIEYPWAAKGVCVDKVQSTPAEPVEPVDEAEVVVPALAATVAATPAESPEVKPDDAPQSIADQAQEAAAAVVAQTDQKQEIAEPLTEQTPDIENARMKTAGWKLGWKDASSLIKLCNAVVALSLTMYCFTLLIGLKITLIARLGGAYYVTSAMFLSMFAAVIFMPWQAAFPGVGLAGAMYMPYEFACATMNYDNLNKCGVGMFYGRFIGLWTIVTLSLVMAQGRSMCWVTRCNETNSTNR